MEWIYLLQAPSLMHQCSLSNVLEEAKSCNNEEITRLAHLASSHLDGLCLNDSQYDDDEFYNVVKEVSIVLLLLSLHTIWYFVFINTSYAKRVTFNFLFFVIQVMQNVCNIQIFVFK